MFSSHLERMSQFF
jgi:hypothetical protein